MWTCVNYPSQSFVNVIPPLPFRYTTSTSLTLPVMRWWWTPILFSAAPAALRQASASSTPAIRLGWAYYVLVRESPYASFMRTHSSVWPTIPHSLEVSDLERLHLLDRTDNYTSTDFTIKLHTTISQTLLRSNSSSLGPRDCVNKIIESCWVIKFERALGWLHFFHSSVFKGHHRQNVSLDIDSVERERLWWATCLLSHQTTVSIYSHNLCQNSISL